MQQKKIRLLTFLFVLSALSAHARLPERIESFPLGDIRLTESPFKQSQDMDIRYLLALDPDRLLAPFLKEAGLNPRADNYTNWENTGLDGHIGGHYLSALSCMYASTGNEEIKSRLEYMLGELKRCQDVSGDGYLCGVPGGRVLWREISEGKIDAGAFSLNGKWVPLYNIHKTYAGLRDAYLHTGNTEAKEMLVKLADWMIRLVSGLSDGQIQEMLRSEHGGLNETFADVAAITGDRRYLKAARQFSHRQVLQPLLQREDRLTGMHANTQIPKVIGFKRIADVEGNGAWSEAARFFWETVVHHRSVSIGGNSVREHFHPADDFSSMLQSEQGVETCNTYNMLRLTKMLYQTGAGVSYMDYYERALYNHILSTQNSVQGGFVYFTPMRPGHYRVYSRPQTGFWCCVGSGMENHARYGEMIYGHRDRHLYVNLFIPSTLRWGEVDIEQQTGFPDEEATTLVIHPDKNGRKFSVHFRLPEWAEQKELRLSVNGKPQKITVENGYVMLNRVWKKGDRVRLEMPMHLRAIALPDGTANYSLLYGPVVLASRLGTQHQDGMFAGDSRGGHIAGGPRLPLQNMPVIVGNRDGVLSHLHRVEDKPLTFTLKGIYPESCEGMILEPFFRLHECRYMVYWPLLSEQELQTRQELLAKEEKERAALDAVTADRVICGEQQSESDHFIQMENSRTGSDGEVRWRETGGWFSCRMKTNGRPAAKIRITFRPEKGLDARVEVNSQPLGILTSEQPNGVAIQEFEIPEVLRSNDSLEVRIGTVNSKVTPHLYEVRLIVDR